MQAQGVRVPTTERLDEVEFWLVSADGDLGEIKAAIEHLEKAFNAPGIAYAEAYANRQDHEEALAAHEATPVPPALTHEEIGRLFLFLTWSEGIGEHIAKVAREGIEDLWPLYMSARPNGRQGAELDAYHGRIAAMLRDQVEHYESRAKERRDA